ncbi:apolipoprotein N-acyltransferase [Gloeocapsa sp. PCC 73106]|uniref:apolipoprotein N-acyltransferase n=1 Tax=Gloeocapsa sp. PCC 73106 TaxID=102232 RepID=UPI0002ABE7BA|nr:apolipoprotein N-acyltransferase [Gloeocapsa sp. PCC 73106]ELR98296.1 apolipoprotein N-acyltransferase [Gloeocapsa sp. PCC 73106]
MRLKILLAIGSGLLMGLAPAPGGMWYLAWIALIPLWVLLSQEKKFNPLISLAWGAGYHGLAISWITGIHPMTWLGIDWWSSLAIALVCWLFLTACGSTLVLIWSGGMYYLQSISAPPWLKVLGGTAIWCGLEYLWSLTPFWWSYLAYTQSPANLIILQLSQFSGHATITAILVAVNGLFAEAYLNRGRSYWVVIALMLALSLHGWGWWLYRTPDEQIARKSVNIGVIQGNIPNEIKLYSSGWSQAMTGYLEGYQNLAKQGVDIVLTPETALPFFLINQDYASEALSQAILSQKVPIWVGTFARQNHRLTNTLLTINSSGEIYSRYDKVNLVPLGEYIPFEGILGSWINRLSPLEARLVAGEPNQLLDTPIGRVAVGICYDSAFAEHFRRQTAQGAQLIISAANNAHYSNSMLAQHHALDVMRGIENDRNLARATNTGYSAFIDHRGRTLWRSKLNTYELHAQTLDLRDSRTLYVRWGDWLTLLLLGLTLAGITRIIY